VVKYVTRRGKNLTVVLVNGELRFYRFKEPYHTAQAKVVLEKARSREEIGRIIRAFQGRRLERG